MQRDVLVKHLDAYFRVADVQDDEWKSLLKVVYEEPYWKDYVQPSWVRSFNGLMVRGQETVRQVATCVFPSDVLLRRVAPGTFVFAEHPVDDAPGDVFAPWSRSTFERIRSDGISVYTVHAPLDHHPEMSPSMILGRGLGLRELQTFFPTCKGLEGGSAVLGVTPNSALEVKAQLQSVLGSEVPVAFGLGLTDDQAKSRPAGRVAIVAGGGASVAALEAALKLGCTTYVTGNALSPCTIPYVRRGHDAFRARAAAAGVVVIDGTHYGTEKPAQLAMVKWFTALGLDAHFERGFPERT